MFFTFPGSPYTRPGWDKSMENDNEEEESSEQLTNDEFTYGLKQPISGLKPSYSNKTGAWDPWIDIPLAILVVVILAGSFAYVLWALIKYLSQ